MKQVYAKEELYFNIGLRCKLRRNISGTVGGEEYEQFCRISYDDDIKRYGEVGWWWVIEIPQYDKVRNTRLGRLLFL